MKKGLLGVIGLVCISFVLAIPSLPHTFMGTATYSGNPQMSLSGYDISASIGNYGLGIVGSVGAQNSYEVIIDPQGRIGEITFYVGGIEAQETHDYLWGGHTEDFSLTVDEMPTYALCGNGVQEPGEQCDGNDLGIGTCENVLGITGASGVLGCTSICTFEYSNCTAPSCGDGVCNGAESCSSCSADCGACPSSGGGSSGGGGGGGTSSRSTSTSNDDNVIVLTTEDEEPPLEQETADLSELEKEGAKDQEEESREQPFMSTALGITLLIFVVLIIILGVISKKVTQNKKIKEEIKHIAEQPKKKRTRKKRAK